MNAFFQHLRFSIALISLSVFSALAQVVVDIRDYGCDAYPTYDTYAQDGRYIYLNEYSGDGFPLEMTIGEATLDYFEQIQNRLAEHNIQLVVLRQPHRLLTMSYLVDLKPEEQSFIQSYKDGYETFLARLEARGIVAPNLLAEYETFLQTDEYKDVKESNIFQYEFFHWPYDAHWTPLGAYLSGQATAKALGVTPQEKYVTSVTGFEDFRPYDLRQVQRKCDVRIPPIIIPTYETKQASSPTGEDMAQALFADEEVNYVVIGSSFTDPEVKEWNFEGFMTEALGESPLFYARSAGGTIAPFIAFAQSDDYQRMRDRDEPAYVIWDIFNVAVFTPDKDHGGEKMDLGYRQILGALNDRCSSEGNVLFEGKGALTQNPEAVSLPAPLAIHNQDYMWLRFAESTLASFDLELSFEGETKLYSFKRRDQWNYDGNFFLELPELGSLNSFRVLLSSLKEAEADSKAGTSFDVKICRSK